MTSSGTTTDWRYKPKPITINYPEGPGIGFAHSMTYGDVVGEVRGDDLWQILVGLTFWLNDYPDNDLPDDFHGYFWAVEAETNFLYDDPTREGFDSTTMRIVSGAIATVDELGWMGFAATFSYDRLAVLVVEVDSNWGTWVEGKEVYEDGKYAGFKYQRLY